MLPARILSAVLAAVLVVHAGIHVEEEHLFVRGKGKPATESVSFGVYNPDGPFLIRLENGPDGHDRVSAARIWLNGAQVFGESDFNQQVEWLQDTLDGLTQPSMLEVLLKSKPGSAVRIEIVRIDDAAPSIHIQSPSGDASTNDNAPLIAVTYDDTETGIERASLAIAVNGVDRTSAFTMDSLSADWQMSPGEALPEGVHTITAMVADRAGNSASDEITFTVDITPPRITIGAPSNGASYRSEVLPPPSYTVTDNLDEAPVVASEGYGTHEGIHTFAVTATDAAGNASSSSVSYTVDNTPPVVRIVSPADGALVCESPVAVSWTIDGVEQDSLLSEELDEGDNAVIRSAVDRAGNVGADTAIVQYVVSTALVEIVSPPNGYTSTTETVSLVVRARAGLSDLGMLVDGVNEAASFTFNGSTYQAALRLPDGHHTLIAHATTGSQSDTARIAFKVRTAPPETQTTIVGRVLDGTSGNPVVGAAVTVVENGSSVTTDTEGGYNLPSGGFGLLTINVTHPDYTEAMRTVSADKGFVVDLDPIQLIELNDEHIIVDAGVDAEVTFQSTGVQLAVPAGALSEATEMSATVYTHIDQLPDEQPGEDVFLFCVNLKPDNAVFAEPVTVRVPNMMELTPGAPVPVTYYNEALAEWEPAGTGHVTPDGDRIEFEVTHFSVYHGNYHHTDDDETPGDDVDTDNDEETTDNTNDETGEKESCPVSKTASEISVKDGDLTLWYGVDGGPAFSDIGAKLVYSSATARPKKTIVVANSYVPITPPYMNIRLFLPGYDRHWVFHGPTQPFKAAYVWQGDSAHDSLETGLYPYGVKISETFYPGRYRYGRDLAENLNVTYRYPTSKTNRYFGFKTFVNHAGSPYGAGWAIEGITRIVTTKASIPTSIPSAYRDPEVGKPRFFATGDTVPAGKATYVALGGVRGSMQGEHVSIVGSGPVGTIYWHDPEANVYHPPWGSADTLIRRMDGWTRRFSSGTVEEYSEDGLLLSRTNSKGQGKRYEYDAFGERVLAIVDVTSGSGTQFEYDARDRLCGIVDQFGRRTAVEVDEHGDLVSIIAPDGRETRRFGYEGHRAVSKTLPGGGTNTYEYDQYGSVVRATTASGRIIEYERSSDSTIVNDYQQIDHDLIEFTEYEGTYCLNIGGDTKCPVMRMRIPTYPTSMVHHLPSAQSSYGYHDQFGDGARYTFDSRGRILTKTNANGETVRYSYTEAQASCDCGEATRIEYPNGLAITRSMDDRGNLVTTYNEATDATTEYTYTTIAGIDNVETITNALGQVTRFEYDSLANLVRLIAPGGDSTRISYNELALPGSVTDARGRTVRTVYDSLGRVTGRVTPLGDTTSYTYDSYGNLASVTDPTGRITHYEYDVVGRLLLEINPAGDTVRYTYDTAGRLDSLIDPLHHHTTFTYDAAGNLIRSTNHMGVSRAYDYDEQQKLTAYTNGRGQTINYEYDALRRLIRKTTSDSTVLARFGYDNMGNMVYAATPEYTMNRRFDAAGRMLRELVHGFNVADTLGMGDTITADNYAYDYTHLVVDGDTVVIDGEHHFLSLSLINGAVVRHLPTDTADVHRLVLHARDFVRIDPTSRIDVSGLGYLGGARGGSASLLGRTEGNSVVGGSEPGAGGSHGGRGGPYVFLGGSVHSPETLGVAAIPYGERLWPTQPGGGGGAGAGTSGHGHNGGGVVHVSAPTIMLDGAIAADGESAFLGGGGAGAGGAIIVEADSVYGIGGISACGGDGEEGYNNPGGGGGGRIFLSASQYLSTTTPLVKGGQGGGTNGTTVIASPEGQVVERLDLASGDTLIIEDWDDSYDGCALTIDSAVVIVNGIHSMHSLVLRNHALLTHDPACDTTCGGVRLDILTQLFIDSTSAIDVSGKGYPGASEGMPAVSRGFQDGATGLSGGSHGGLGGCIDGHSGASYGSTTNPVDFGAGGSCDITAPSGHGGNGGGSISVQAAFLHVDGSMLANGGDGGGGGGGGAGGSIVIRCDTLRGAGLIAANGGHGTPGAGAGSGGRIAVHGQMEQYYTGRVSVLGGWGRALGAMGTAYFGAKDSLKSHHTAALRSQQQPLVVTATATGWDSADVLLSGSGLSLNGMWVFRSVGLRDNSYITHESPQDGTGTGLVLWVADSIVIDPSSVLDVSAKGYPGGNSNNCALTVGWVCGATGASGGSHGGAGGEVAGVSGPAYGSVHTPVNMGSGGSIPSLQEDVFGGAGGGSISLSTERLVVEGRVLASGQSASAGGAGSGGSILIDANSLEGSGMIEAVGGTAGNGGGGGGGRIALLRTDMSRFPLYNIDASGGYGLQPGGPGTIYLQYNDSLIEGKASTGDTLQVLGDSLVLASGDSNFEGRHVKVVDATFVSQGVHQLASFTAVRSECTISDTLRVLSDVVLRDSSTVKHHETTPTEEYHLAILAAGTIFIDSTSAIDVTGTGYVGDDGVHGARTLGNAPGSTSGSDEDPMWYWGAHGGAGGSHGGLGGYYNEAYPGVPNPVYGSTMQPITLGSGGGGLDDADCWYNCSFIPGGDGGGGVYLAADVLQCDGSILACGEGWQYGPGGIPTGVGGGSGGAVLIEAGEFLGAGQVLADGGDGMANGGGGRIAVHASRVFSFDKSKISASAVQTSSSPASARNGTTVISVGGQGSELMITSTGRPSGDSVQFVFDSADAVASVRSMLIENENVEIWGNREYARLNLVGSQLHFHGHLSCDTLILRNGALLTLEGALTADTVLIVGASLSGSGDMTAGALTCSTSTVDRIGDMAVGMLRLESCTFKAMGCLTIEDTAVLGVTSLETAGPISVGGDLTLARASAMKHMPATFDTAFRLFLNAGGTLTVDSTSRIDVSGCGYCGGYLNNDGQTVGNTPGSTFKSGASHGGAGVDYNSSYRSCAMYGNFYYPRELGSGGGVGSQYGYPYQTNLAGGAGGGAVWIRASRFHCDGYVAADGAQGRWYAGSGSGGSVLVEADSMSGSGAFSAIGGSELVSRDIRPGGGGRIAVHAYYLSDSLTMTTKGGGEGAGAGTVYLRDATRPAGVLLVDNDGFAAGDSSTSLIAIGPGTITRLTPDTLFDDDASFAPYVVGHSVKINFDLISTANTFPVSQVRSHMLVVDTAGTHGLLGEGEIGDPYIGIYEFDSVIVTGGANVCTEGLVFYDYMYLDNGAFTSYTGTQTGGITPPDTGIRLGMREPPQPSASERRAKRRHERMLRRYARKAAREYPSVDISTSQMNGLGVADTLIAVERQVATAEYPVDHLPAQPFSLRFADPHIRFATTRHEVKSNQICPDGDPVYTYDKLDRVTSMTSPVGTTEYEYDPVTGRLTKIVSPEGKEFIFSYDRGQLETLSRPNGIVTHYAFDDNGNLTVLDHRLGVSSVARYEYTYDPNGMRTSMTDLDGVHDYVYDTLYQIIQATHPTVTNPTELFEYDAAGNRLFDEQRAYSYNELNQLVEDDEHWYEYDLDGNMTLKVEKATGDSTKFFWDIENRLVRVEKPGTVAEYSYGPLGRRFAKTVNGVMVEFRHSGEDLILEMDDSGQVAGSWTFGPGIDNPLAMNRGGMLHCYLADGLGSIVALTDETGRVVKSYDYGTFGGITEEVGALQNQFAYTAREWEPETGLYYYRLRYYAPELGRFVQVDPIGFGAGDHNLYRYAGNDPVNWTDPMGLTVVISGDPKFVRQMQQIYDLVKTTEHGQKMALQLEASECVYKIQEARRKALYLETTCGGGIWIDLSWHPKVSTTEGRQRASSASMLAHEMGHATGTKDQNRNISENENPVRHQLGEPERLPDAE